MLDLEGAAWGAANSSTSWPSRTRRCRRCRASWVGAPVRDQRAWPFPYSSIVASSVPFGSREDRIAYNEVYCRDLNERKVVWISGGDLAAGFRCECGREDCFERIPMSRSEWNEARAKPTRFAVVPGHIIADVETVVSEYPHVWVVEKRGRAGEAAEESAEDAPR
jgi:hypothetical protein